MNAMSVPSDRFALSASNRTARMDPIEEADQDLHSADEAESSTAAAAAAGGTSGSEVATGSAAAGAGRVRQRAARACSNCSRSKLKCDGATPCSRCISSGAPEPCEYLPSRRGKTRKRAERTGDDRMPSGRAEGDHDAGTIIDKRPRPTSPGLSRHGSSIGPYPPITEDRPAPPPKNYDRWKRDSALARAGPTNTALWGEQHEDEDESYSPRPAPVSLPQYGTGGGPSTSQHGQGAFAYPSQPVRASSFSHSSPGSASRPPGRSPSDQAGRRPFSAVTDKLTTLPLPGDAHNPLAVLAEASATTEDDEDQNSPGVRAWAGQGGGGRQDGARGYYAPLERKLKDEAPHIMTYINVHEAEQLFDLYFKYLHPHLPLIDKAHSSPSAVARRSNFLFNAICCVAARAFNVVIWERLKDFAQFEMERLPKEKNIDVVQGHLIYAEWNLIRPKHFEQDMSWLRVGVAVRTAIDINLHRVALLSQAREGLPTWLLRSIIRTWLMSYVIDRTLSAQLGKPSSMRGENSINEYMKLLKEGEERPTAEDLSVAAWAEWTQILARTVDVFRNEAAEHQPASLGNQNSFPDLVHVFDKQARQWRERTEESARVSGADQRSIQFMVGRTRIYDHYLRLVVRSFGLQRALACGPVDLPAAFAEYQLAAKRLIHGFENDLEAVGLVRGCPDFVFTVLTYAAVSLLKALEPQFAHLDPDRGAIMELARHASAILGRSAMSPDHLPASQSVFLSRLIHVKSAASTASAFEPAAAAMAFKPIDFEAFAQSLDRDQSKTLWPPMPMPMPMSLPPSSGGLAMPASAQNHTGQQSSTGGHTGMTAQSNDSAPSAAPTDLASWAAANQYSVPGAALGLSVDTFMQDQDMFFSQDSVWKAILEGIQTPAGGTV